MGFLNDIRRWVTLEQELYRNTVRQWLIALGVFLAAAIAFRLVKAAASRRAANLAGRTQTGWDDALVAALEATRLWFLFTLAAFVASLTLVLPAQARAVVESITVIVLLLQAAVWGNVLITFALTDYVRRRMETDAAAVTTVTAVGFIGKLALYAVVLLLILANLGVDVTALIAGLGVGGIAVALAAQNVLGDLFASLSIVLDKPFVLGDFIVVGDVMGTVEKIGLKTTRLRSLSGEQLVLSNNDLLQSRIRNFKRMFERRVVFSLGVTYDTPRETLAAIPAMIREIVQAQEHTRFDRAHFQRFGASSLDFETVYYVTKADYNLSMDIQQAINLAILERFAAEGIAFAYPTQTVYVEQGESDSAAVP